MDLKMGLLFWAVFVMVSLSTEGSLYTKPTTKGTFGKDVYLECTFKPNTTWFVIQWLRVSSDNSIVTIQNPNPMDPQGLNGSNLWPIWSNDDYKNRGRTEISHNNTVINFNIRLDNFKCTDVGSYECRVVGSLSYSSRTEVGIVAEPDPPSIHQNVLIVEENSNFTLDCFVTVGIPPAPVFWYIKRPNDQEFKPLLSYEDSEVQESDTCVPRINQQVQASITDETSGSVFQCRVQSSLIKTENNQYSDEIIVETRQKFTTEAPYEVSCSGKNCNLNRTAALGSEPNEAPSKPRCAVSMVMTIMIMGVFVFT